MLKAIFNRNNIFEYVFCFQQIDCHVFVFYSKVRGQILFVVVAAKIYNDLLKVFLAKMTFQNPVTFSEIRISLSNSYCFVKTTFF